MEQPAIHADQETDTGRGWTYRVTATLAAPAARPGADADQRERTLFVSLAWVDHDHLSGGAVSPSHTVEAVVAVVLELEDDRPDAQRLPDRFDVSTARRLAPDFDERVRHRLRPHG